MTPPLPRLLITAGPTHEPVDRVRYLGNRSSGRMGLALAEAAAARGLPTTLLLGPLEAERVPDHSHPRICRFQTASDLDRLLRSLWPDHDILLMAAAVADYRPSMATPEKIRRSDRAITLELEPVPDLVAELGSITRKDQIRVAFALEPAAEMRDAARSKLARKGVDAVVANPLETLGAERITASLITHDAVLDPPADSGEGLTKAQFAEWLLDRAIDLWRAKSHDRASG